MRCGSITVPHGRFVGTFDEPVKGEVADLVPEVRTEPSAQAEQREWDVQRAGRSPGLRIEHKQKSWGDTQVRWEYDWLGIHLPTGVSAAVREAWGDDQVVCEEFPWLDRKAANEPYWGYVPKERFRNEEELELLFNEHRRSEYAKDLAVKLVSLAEYCDEKFPG